jgi:hypothetical protein
MDRPTYPEKWKRERMLFFVHEWLEENPPEGVYVPTLDAHIVETWGDSQEGLNGAQAMLLFKQLVDEGDIFLVQPLDTRVSGLPWSTANPQKLSKWSLMEIGELPNPDQELSDAMESAIEKIKNDPSIPAPQKQDWLAWLDRGITLLRTAQGLGDLIQKQL